MAENSRSRIITWDDPMIGAKAARQMTGLEFFQAMGRGEIPPPPIMLLIGSGVSEVEVGRVVFTLIPQEFHYNPIGTVHGGIISTICDSALGCTVHTTLPLGVSYTTLELKVNFIRAVTHETGELFCEGKVIHVGGRVATAECCLTDKEGRLYAHGTPTCIILRPEKEKNK